MGVDRNGMSHKPKGLPARVAGTYDTGRQAAGDDDLIDTRTIAANLLTDPDIHDIGSLSDLTGRMRATRPGDSDDRPLAHAWITFDPTTENGGDEERAAIIMRGIRRPLHLDDPDGTLRRLLCLRIRHTALDPLREIRRLGLKEYDTIDPDTADDPYGNMSNDPDAIARERERQREEDRRLMERDRQARAKAKATRERHTHDEYGSMADDYDRFTREYADYWQALGQGAGLTGDAPQAGRMAMARIALRMHDRYDPRRAAAYRRTPAFKRLEKQLLDGRRPTVAYQRIRETVTDDDQYRQLMRMLDRRPDMWTEPERKTPRPIYGFGRGGQALALRYLIEHRGVDDACDILLNTDHRPPNPYGVNRIEDLLDPEDAER